jgi:hypothetical protein
VPVEVAPDLLRAQESLIMTCPLPIFDRFHRWKRVLERCYILSTSFDSLCPLSHLQAAIVSDGDERLGEIPQEGELWTAGGFCGIAMTGVKGVAAFIQCINLSNQSLLTYDYVTPTSFSHFDCWKPDLSRQAGCVSSPVNQR